MSDEYKSMDKPLLTPDQIKAFTNLQPTYTNILATQVQHQFEENVNAVQRAREEKEAEELRRHEELVESVHEIKQTMKETVLEALKIGANVNIDSNSGSINISMNSTNVEQHAVQDVGVDFEAVQSMISGIEKYFGIPELVAELGDKADVVAESLAEIKKGIEKKDSGFIKRALNKLKELALGIESSLIATGIVEGMKKIGMFI